MKIISNDKFKENQKIRPSFQKWKYLCPLRSEKVVVCKTFFTNVISVSKDRIATVQKKVLSNETLADTRGKHENHFVKLTDDLKCLIKIHCESIPSTPPHYTRENTKLFVF